MKIGSNARFPLIMLGSVGLHLVAVALLYGSYIYGVYLKFGSLEIDDSGESRYTVAMLDRTKPLYLPAGFYAVEKPPEEVKKPEEREKTDDPEKAKKDEKDEKEAEDGTPSEEPPKPPDEAPPGSGMKFGKISGGSLRPHLENIYRAHSEGRIAVDTFKVTVSCKAMPDGSLSGIKVVQSSGDPLIDETALNLIKEIGAMKALAPLSTLSSLSLTLDKSASSTKLTAVGFADDPDVTTDLANQLGGMKTLARFGAKNQDQTTLIDNIDISQSGNRVSVSVGLGNGTAGDMMKRSFGPRETASSGT